MRSTPILITGGSGFIGSYLVRAFAQAGASVTSTYFEHADRIPADLRAHSSVRWLPLDLARFALGDEQALASALDDRSATTVIHTAALADLARAERDFDLARRVNVDATERLARFAHQAGARFIFFSTDQVFDGESSWYVEDDQPAPINAYGRSKVEAEAAVRSVMPEGAGVSLRVSLVYGRSADGERSACEQILRALRRGASLRLFTDEHRTPTFLDDIADVVVSLVDRQPRGARWPDVVHVAGPDRVNRFELGRRVAGLFGYGASRIEPARRADVDLGMPRPGDLSLDITLARTTLGFQPHTLDEGLRAWRKTLQD